MKFGASTLKDGGGISHVANLVRTSVNEGNNVVVVTTSLAGVSEDILATAVAAKGGKGQAVADFVRELKGKLRRYARQAVSRPSLRKSIGWEVEEYCNKIESLLYSVFHTNELTDRTKDRLLSLAERMSTSLVSGSLESLGVITTPLTGHDAGVLTDSAFGRARPIKKLLNERVKRSLLPLIERGVTAIVAGNATADEHGNPTTLGLGGADYLASMIGAAISADEVCIWVGVDGIMTADPNIVPGAKTLPVLSYAEAAELAFSGVRILHPRTIEPAMEKDIPVIVRNAFNLENPGTRIVREPERYEGVVKSVSVIKDVAMIAVEGASMIGRPGTAARTFGALAREGINILMISQSCSETNISLIIQSSDLTRALAALNAEFRDEEPVRRFFVQDNVCVVAAIGSGMRGTPGIASRVFNAVANKGINVLMAAQGSDELNISFVVIENDSDESVRAIHEEFELGRVSG